MEERMRETSAVLALILLLAADGRVASALVPAVPAKAMLQAQAGRSARPEASDVAATDAALEKLFKQRLAAARKPAEKSALARELGAMAREAGSDDAMRWSLLRLGMRLAASAGDERLHEDLLEEQLQRFDLPAPRTRLDQWRSFAEAAKGLKDKALSQRIEARLAELSEEIAEAERLAPALEMLAKDPADPAANLVVGRNACFVEREWARGLEHLARGSDPLLRELAARELSSLADASARLELGRSWLAFGARQKEPACTASSERGRAWLGRAWPDASGDERQTILTELRAIWLRRADIAKERLDGRWTETAELATPKDLGTNRVLVSPDRRTLLTTHWRWWDAEDESARAESVRAAFWRMPEGKLLAEWSHGIENPWHLAFSRDGILLLVTGQAASKRLLALHAVPSGDRLWTVEDAGDWILRPGFCADGRTLIAPRDNGRGSIAWCRFDLATGRELGIVLDDVDAMSAVVGPDGRWMLALERDLAAGRRQLVVRDTRTGALETRLQESSDDSGTLPALEFAGSTWALIGAGQGASAQPASGAGASVVLWDLLAGVPLAQAEVSHPEVSVVVPSPSAGWAMVHSTKYTPIEDGSRLATTATELVNLTTGRRLAPPAHWKRLSPPWQLDFLGGGLVVGTDENYRVKIWTIAPR
jgi:hypothetical protein